MWFRSVAVVAVLLSASAASASHADDVAVGEPWTLHDPEVLLDTDRVEVAVVGPGRLPSAVGRGVAPPETSDPSAPWGLVAHPTPEGVRLDWMAPIQGEPDGYNVYRSVDGGEPVLLAQTVETTYTDPMMQEAREEVHGLVYHVTASYGPAESAASNPAVAVVGLVPCFAFHVYPDIHGNRTPPVDFGVNEHFVDCVLNNRPGD